jgi:ABC-type lipoprotein release transport system permease subunit
MSGPNLAKIAWRNLWRQKRRTLVTLSSIAFGGFLAIMMTAMQDRSFADFIDTAARLGNGHVTIQHLEYQDSPTFSRPVTKTDERRAAAAKDKDVDIVVDRTSGMTMLSTSSDSFGAIFIAYDPEKETEKSFAFAEGVEEGEMFKTADDKGIILGKKLAKNLGAKMGSKVVFTLTDRHGEIVSSMGRVRAIVTTGAPSLDAGLCLLPINQVRKTLGYDPTEATQVGVFLEDSRKALDVRGRLKSTVGSDVAVLTWDQIQPELEAFIAMKVGGARVMILFIAILVAAGIFNTLFVSVMERVREFGIMLAIGYSSGQIFRLVFWESLWLATVGVILSAIVTAGPYYYLATHGIDLSEAYTGGDQPVEVAGVGFDMTLHIGIFPDHALFIAFCVVAATLAAGLYPAWKAGRVEPVETIRVV